MLDVTAPSDNGRMRGRPSSHPSERLAGRYRIDAATGCWVWTFDAGYVGVSIAAGTKKPVE